MECQFTYDELSELLHQAEILKSLQLETPSECATKPRMKHTQHLKEDLGLVFRNREVFMLGRFGFSSFTGDPIWAGVKLGSAWVEDISIEPTDLFLSLKKLSILITSKI